MIHVLDDISFFLVKRELTEELFSLLISVLATSDGATLRGEGHGKDSEGECISIGDDSSSAQSAASIV